MFEGQFAKYRALFFAVTGLIIFFLLFLAANSALLSQALQASNISSLVNTIEKSIDGDTDSVKQETVRLLNLLKNGDAKSNTPAVDDFIAPEQSNIQTIINKANDGIDVKQVRSSINALSATVEQKADKKQKLIQALQYVAAILVALLYFLLVVPLFIRLARSKETEQIVQKETEGIMSTVSEGLFLLNSDHEIGVEQSASLKSMFKLERDLEGNFFDFILDYVTQDNVNIAKDYIELLFGDRVKERLVEDLNPLKQVEINIIRRDGSYENRYLDFKFKRVLVDGKLSHLLGSVTDVTKQVMLERELIESREEQEAQIDLLMSILHVDNRQLEKFFGSTSTSLNNINETLESRGHTTSEIRSKLEDISREVHRIKGDAASLNLNSFEFAAHALEDEIEKLQKTSGKIGGKQLLTATTKLRDLFTELDRMKSLVDKFSSAMLNNQALSDVEINELKGHKPDHQPQQEQHNVDGIVENVNDDIDSLVDHIDSNLSELDDVIDTNDDRRDFDSIAQLASTVGTRNDVSVNYSSQGLSDGLVPKHLDEAVHSTLVQLVRNSIVHGGESPEQRVAKGKTEALNINANFTVETDHYQLEVNDDGLGIDSDKIIEQAVKQGLITEEKAQTIEPEKAIALIFKPGFSSKGSADIDGGRGVGLDVVLDLTKQHKGKIAVRSSKGKSSVFVFKYPLSEH